MTRAWMAGGLALWWGWQTAQYVPVWNTPLSLAMHVVQVAPSKPRALLNYGTMLVVHGQLSNARTAFMRAHAMAQAPHVPPYDRTAVTESATENLRAVAVLVASARARGWTGVYP